MKKILASLILSTALGGCVVAPAPVEVAYEPDVVVGLYPIGYYNPAYGYWTGYGWDVNFYLVGHPGYGHYYRGAPAYARGNFHGGYRGGFRGHR